MPIQSAGGAASCRYDREGRMVRAVVAAVMIAPDFVRARAERDVRSQRSRFKTPGAKDGLK